MTEQDFDNIPVLEDVVVAGNLDKAVTGGIDVNNPTPVETFDALFEAQTDQLNQNKTEDSDSPTITENDIDNIAPEVQKDDEDKLEAAFPNNKASHIDFWESSDFHQDHHFNRTIDPKAKFSAVIQDSTTEVDEPSTLSDEDLFNKTMAEKGMAMADAIKAEPLSTQQSIPNTTESLQTSPDVSLDDTNEKALEPIVEEALDSDDIHETAIAIDNSITETTNNDSEKIEAQHSDESISSDVIAASQNIGHQIDIQQLTESIVLELMPAIESQVRTLVQSTLEKNLENTTSSRETDFTPEKDPNQ